MDTPLSSLYRGAPESLFCLEELDGFQSIKEGHPFIPSREDDETGFIQIFKSVSLSERAPLLTEELPGDPKH